VIGEDSKELSHGRNFYFETVNMGMKNIGVDLKKPEKTDGS
jgi:hypothetical protein